MSKFVDNLHNISKASVSSIGFHATTHREKSSPMLLIAGLAGTGVKSAEAIASVNVDAGLVLNGDFKKGGLKRMIKVLGNIPLGVVVNETAKDKLDELIGSGCDFVVFDMRTPVAVLEKEEVGKFLMIEPSIDMGMVKAINSLDVNGVFINKGEEPFITVKQVLICQRFSELLDKPLLVTLPSIITSAELSNLWKAGVDGIVVPPAQPVEAFSNLRKMINKLPSETNRRQAKVGVVLPRYGGDVAGEEEEGEEEEEEES